MTDAWPRQTRCFGAVDSIGGEDGLIWGRRPPAKEYFGFRGAREPPSSQEASDSATPSTCAPVGTALALRARREARRLAGDRRHADGRKASWRKCNSARRPALGDGVVGSVLSISCVELILTAAADDHRLAALVAARRAGLGLGLGPFGRGPQKRSDDRKRCMGAATRTALADCASHLMNLRKSWDGEARDRDVPAAEARGERRTRRR